ncbi:MAG: hypothetical protein WAS07_04395, partial [Micropruina sp.]
GHLRTKNTDHEIDLIVEADDRSTVAIEVKLSDTIRPADIEHLNWLGQQLGDRLVERIIIYTGKLAYRRPDGIAVVPLALLGPRTTPDVDACLSILAAPRETATADGHDPGWSLCSGVSSLVSL